MPENSLPKATIFDVDGTLVDVRPYRHLVQRPKGEQDFDAFHRAGTTEARLIPEAVDLLKRAQADGHRIIVVSGRNVKWREATRWHLAARHVTCDELLFRGAFMRGSDPYIKEQIYQDVIAPRYDVVHAVDDQPVIARVWRALGIPKVTLIPGWTDADETSMGYGPDVYERWPA